MGGAKNCPETPRQKMIGMMYLVLTAMLALNVSADILNGFTKLRNSMDASMRATKLRTEDVMINFQAAYEKDGGEKKYGDWWAIAQAVNTSSNDFYDYIDQFKLDIINMIDGKEYASMAEVEKVENNGDTNKPHQYALNEKNPENGKIHADEFKEKMDAFRTYVTVVESPCLLNKIARDPKFAHEWDMKVKMMSDLFSTDNVESKEGDGTISWQQSTFDEMPAGAVLALLTKYQNDVRVAQNDLINFMFSAAGSSDFSVNSVEAVVLARNGSYVMQGQHFVADIYSAMVDTNQRPRVFINGQELEGGRYDVVASGVGPHTFSGYMLIGDDTTHYAIPTQTYTVGAPSATISNIEMNVMYRGYDNKFSVSVPGRSAEQVKVTCSNATVSKNGANWIIVPGSGDKSVIEVFAEVDGHSTSMGKQEFRVKNLPDPKLYFENGNSQFKNGQQVSRKIITDANSRVTAGFGKDVELQANLKVTGFSLKVGSKIIQVSGDKLSGPALAEVKKLRAGDMVRILGVKVQGPKGPVGNEKENNILLELN